MNILVNNSKGSSSHLVQLFAYVYFMTIKNIGYLNMENILVTIVCIS